MERGPGAGPYVGSKVYPPGVRFARPWRCGSHFRPSRTSGSVSGGSGLVPGGASELPEGHFGPPGGSFLDHFGVPRALKVGSEQISR